MVKFALAAVLVALGVSHTQGPLMSFEFWQTMDDCDRRLNYIDTLPRHESWKTLTVECFADPDVAAESIKSFFKKYKGLSI